MLNITFDIVQDSFPELKEKLKEYEGHCVAYLINNEKQIYIGETSHLKNRFKDHAKSKGSLKFNKSKIIMSDFFNKSAVYDVETKLIEYIFADKKFELINKKTNQNSHEYFMKTDINDFLFKKLWEKLRNDGLAVNSLTDLENTELFKYSPFKEFSEHQLNVINAVLNLISYETDKELIAFDGSTINQRELESDAKSIIIKGGAGTGKTILITKLVYEIEKVYQIEDISIGICVPQTSLQGTFKKLLRDMKLKAKIIRPIDLSKNLDEKFDLLIVDEAHRLKRHFNKQTKDLKHLEGGKYTEFDFAQNKSKHLILMFDEKQTVRPADINRDDLKLTDFHQFELHQQFRVKKGRNYLKFVQSLLHITEDKPNFDDLGNYTFEIVDSIQELHTIIKQKNEEFDLCRISSGYYKPWISKTNKKLYDFDENGYKLQWNTSLEGWVQSQNAINEVGCIHTLQGQDLNYAGVIIGNDICFDEMDGKIKINKSNYFDRNGTPINGTDIENLQLTQLIKNIYYVLLSRGMLGTYIYIEDAKLKSYIKSILSINH